MVGHARSADAWDADLIGHRESGIIWSEVTTGVTALRTKREMVYATTLRGSITLGCGVGLPLRIISYQPF